MKLSKTLKKILLGAVVTAAGAALLSGCGGKAENKVVIWTSGEDYRNTFYLSELEKKFPDYDIQLEYMNSSTIAAKVLEEGEKCSCDIICSEEYGYLAMCEEYLADIEDFDYSVYLDDAVSKDGKFTPECRNGGCIIINPSVLKEKGLEKPTSYEDLTDPKYKGLISMPNPKTSGTGYMFVRQLTNEWGEDKAFEYFDRLAENVLAFTSSGSGPVNALVQGEVAVGLGMTAQALVEINDGADLEILFFDEGSPYGMYGNAILASSADRQCVKDVFEYLATDLCRENNKRFCPDQIFKDVPPAMEGFPKDIKYGNMANDTLTEKERLIAKWKYE